MIRPFYDYARVRWYFTKHTERYIKRALLDGLICQECRGAGGETVPILDDGSGPWETCGWCLGGGYVTRYVHGQWLHYKSKVRKGVW